MHSNRLINELSPYLLQHAHNPVDWYPWGEEALNKAREEDKPILVSIGYAACHWCHVMERESFEKQAVADIMNRYFVNIKIDREERPDIDHIYMDAVQAMTGSGGWPLNVFLTPEGKPFYGGTYFPPVKAYNRPSWTEVLMGVANAYRERKEELIAQADNLTEHLQSANLFGKTRPDIIIPPDEMFTVQQLKLAYDNLMKMADTEEGGFGKAPKFPSTFSIAFLLRYYHFFGEKKALQQACLSLDKMIYGGIYDQLGGGLARYSTDNEWLVPHFEKMLYDNALLLVVLSEALQITGNPEYERVIHETIAFVKRELMTNEKLFLSALDADSEGEEGRFYVWSKKEINELLQQDAQLFCAFYDVTEGGNWEEKNILRIKTPLRQFAAEHGMDEMQLREMLQNSAALLMQHRSKRIRPQTDDKVLLSWNALMNTALTRAFAATGQEEYRTLAMEHMQALLQRFDTGENGFSHTWKNGLARYPAFLDDYAYLIKALILLQEITSENKWLLQAKRLTEWVKNQFQEEDGSFFFYTSTHQRDIIVRKKEIYDGATPSGNAVMASNLHYLSVIFDKPEWKEQAVQNLSAIIQAVIRYPASFGVWNSLLFDFVTGLNEIAIVGTDFARLRDEFNRSFHPNAVLQSAPHSVADFPLLKDRENEGKTLLYLCRNYTCQQPVTSVDSLNEIIVKSHDLQHNK
jgi:uncharacterized protein YyaL (SSP411 family)